jgi:hypothetical protein
MSSNMEPPDRKGVNLFGNCILALEPGPAIRPFRSCSLLGHGGRTVEIVARAPHGAGANRRIRSGFGHEIDVYELGREG